MPVDRVANLSFGSRVAYILIQAECSDPSASQTPMRLVKLGRKHRQCYVYEFPWEPDIYVLEVKHASMQRQTMSVQRHHVYRLPSCQHCSSSGEIKCIKVPIHKILQKKYGMLFNHYYNRSHHIISLHDISPKQKPLKNTLNKFHKIHRILKFKFALCLPCASSRNITLSGLTEIWLPDFFFYPKEPRQQIISHMEGRNCWFIFRFLR